MVIAPRYDAIGEFKEYGYAVMQRQGRVGLLNQYGKEMLPPQYDDIKILDSLLFAVLDANDWMVVNVGGKVILKNGYEQVNLWCGKYISFRKDKKWGIANVDGKIIASPKFDEILFLKNQFFQTKLGNKFGLLTVDGKEILSNESDEIQVYNSQLLFFQKNKKWGAVNAKGQQVIRPSFQSFFRLSDNFIKLISNARIFLYAIAQEKIITKGQYETYYAFSNNYVLCKKNRKLGLLNASGNKLLEVQYDEIQYFCENQFRVNRDGKWGVVSFNDEIIIPLIYEFIRPLQYKMCVVKNGGRLGIVNAKGKEQVASKFNRIFLEKNKAKAYQGDLLTVLNFDDAGNLRGEDQFENHLTLKIRGKKKQTTSANEAEVYNYQLEQFEWFYDARQDKWGLRKLEDGTVHIEPVFDYVQVERNVNFTLVGIEKRNKLSFDRTTYGFDMVFGLVDNENGLVVTPLELLDVRFSDFKKGSPTARVVFADGSHGLVGTNGAYLAKDFAFIDDFQDGVARMSMRGKLSGNLKNKDKAIGKVKSYLGKLLSPNYMTDFTQHDQDFRDEAALTCSNCEWGYIDTTAKIMVRPQYSFVEKMVNQVGIVELENKSGAVRSDGSTLLKCEYDEVSFLKNTNNQMLKIYRSADKFGLIDTLAKVAIDLKYDEIGELTENRLAVMSKGLWGFADLKGKEIIRCRYRKVGRFQEGYAAAQLGNKWGFIDENGGVVVEFKYHRVGNFKDGLAWVSSRGKVGYINSEDEKVILPKFDKAYDFENNVARVVVNGEYGLINKVGEYFLRPKFNHINPFNEHGIAVVQIGKERIRYGLVNRTGNLVGEKFKQIGVFNEGLALVKNKNGYGYINPQGQVVVPCEYSKGSGFSEGLASVKKGGECGYIDKEGTVVIPLIYSRCLDFEDGKAIVFRGMRNAGVIDKTGSEIIEPSINGLVGFSDSRGLIRDASWNYYYITDEGRFYEGFYDYAQAFQNGIAVVQKNGKWGIINQNGLPVVSPKYDKIEAFKNGYAKVKINGFSGLTNLAGETIVPTNFEFISYAGNGLFRVEQGDKVGYFNAQGDWVWNLQN